MKDENCLLHLIPDKKTPLYLREERKGASLDTFYGSLACDPLYRYTLVRRVVAKIQLSKKALCSICHLTKMGERTLIKKEVSGEGELVFDLPSSGLVYMRLTLEEETEVLGGGYYALEEKRNDVSLAVVICTYRREEYVKRNVKAIERFCQRTGEEITVFVVDNGRTLTTQELPGAVLIKNANLGGSGGFCRGMAEAKKGGFSHVLLMDDDVTFEEDIFCRIIGFLRYVREADKVGVGAAMMVEEKPTVQFELGGKWDGDRLKGMGKNVDLTDPMSLYDNATRKDADYTAWWCCCMPLSVVDKVGYPMPFFIKNDDVEYGIRSELTWAFPSGVGVWHTSFESKYSPFLEYYIKRNELISNCLNRKRGVFSQIKKTVRSAALQLVQQRYFVLPYVIKGWEDFLKGPEFLADLDAEKTNRELLLSQPKKLSAAELFAFGYDANSPVHGKKRNKFWQIVTLNGQLLPTFFYKKEGRKRMLDCSDCPPRDFFGATETAQFNYFSKKGFITKQSRKELFKWAVILLKMSVRTLFTYGKVCRKYQRQAPYLSSLEYWNKKWSNSDE